MGKKDQTLEARRALGAFIKQRREALGYSQEELASKLGYQKQIISEIERGNRKIPLDEMRIKKLTSELKLEDPRQLLKLILATSVSGELLELLEIGNSSRAEVQNGKKAGRQKEVREGVIQLTDYEDDIIYLKRLHDKLIEELAKGLNGGSEDKGRKGVSRNYLLKLDVIKERLREISDDEILALEKMTCCLELIVPDLSYELPSDYGLTYVEGIKNAYRKGVIYEYLLPATRPVYEQYLKYANEVYKEELKTHADQFRCRFLKIDDWQRLASHSGYYSGRCLYELRTGGIVGIEYDRKRSAKNFLMTLAEVNKFKKEFQQWWNNSRTLKDTASVLKYLHSLEGMEKFMEELLST